MAYLIVLAAVNYAVIYATFGIVKYAPLIIINIFHIFFALAVPFWRSGVNKWDGFLQLNDVAVLLFASEFMLHLPGGPYPFPAPAVMAFLAGSAEILLPVLLVLGLATRMAAAGLLFMTLIVQLTVPDGWPLPPWHLRKQRPRRIAVSARRCVDAQ